jgi:secondary thiamine-phosphate synthase enzyme
MPVRQQSISVATRGKGLHEITEHAARFVRSAGLQQGLLHVFVQHTSCSLVIMENADPSARRDLENFFERMVPENDPHFEHTAEGQDDMPSHIKMALTRTSETIPIGHGELLLGTWQGLFLWEHRARPHHRKVVFTAWEA